MNVAVKPTSVRLSSGTQALLDNASKRLRRSKSYLVEEALKAQLASVALKETELANTERLNRLMALKGAGARGVKPMTPDDIEARQRAFRGED